MVLIIEGTMAVEWRGIPLESEGLGRTNQDWKASGKELERSSSQRLPDNWLVGEDILAIG